MKKWLAMYYLELYASGDWKVVDLDLDDEFIGAIEFIDDDTLRAVAVRVTEREWEDEEPLSITIAEFEPLRNKLLLNDTIAEELAQHNMCMFQYDSVECHRSEIKAGGWEIRHAINEPIRP